MIVLYLLFLLIPRTVAGEAARAKCRGEQSSAREKDVVCVTLRHRAKQEMKGGCLSKEAGTALAVTGTLTLKEWSWSAGRR